MISARMYLSPDDSLANMRTSRRCRRKRELSNAEQSIAAELEVARERNPSHWAYPIWATALTGRRDNLKATIAVLSERLATVEQSINQLQV